MGGHHHTCCNQQKVKRGLWSPEEDEKLIRYITAHGYGCWSEVPDKAGLQRCGKSCRLRWINYLRPDIRRGRFTQEEEKLIISLHGVLGNRWAQIASHLPGRTDNEIKNYWNSWIKKKLRKPSRLMQQPNLSTTVNVGHTFTTAGTDQQYPLHYDDLLNCEPNRSIFECVSGAKTLKILADHQQEPSFPFPSLKNSSSSFFFMFDTNTTSLISHTDSTPTPSLANPDLVWSFTTDDNQSQVIAPSLLPPHQLAVENRVEMGFDNNNYLQALVDGDHHHLELQYDQCQEKHHDLQQQVYNCNNNNDELSLWEESQQCPSFLFWDNNVVEGSTEVVDEVSPFLSLEGLSPYTSSLP
ncbi:unnamed protein product [Rhodiola kirilowii]